MKTNKIAACILFADLHQAQFADEAKKQLEEAEAALEEAEAFKLAFEKGNLSYNTVESIVEAYRKR